MLQNHLVVQYISNNIEFDIKFLMGLVLFTIFEFWCHLKIPSTDKDIQMSNTNVYGQHKDRRNKLKTWFHSRYVKQTLVYSRLVLAELM